MSVATVAWQRLDVPGLEHFRLLTDAGGPRLMGTIVAVDGGTPLELRYEVTCSPTWETRRADLTLVSGNDTRRRALEVDGRQRWRADGREITGVAGCVDVDVSLTPSTNVLPIRRLGLLDLPVGEWREVTAAWVTFPDLGVQPLPQRYTRLAARRFRYESRGGAFTAELEVDDLGLVVSYPPFWRRVAGV